MSIFIANQIWELLVIKMDFKGNNNKIRGYDVDLIILILQFMAFNKSHWKEKYADNAFKLFEHGYNCSYHKIDYFDVAK